MPVGTATGGWRPARRYPSRISLARRIFLSFLTVALVLVALVGTAFSQIPVGDFRFDGRILGSHKANGLSRSAGFFARVYDSTNPQRIPDAITASPPYATLFANIWLPRGMKFDLASFPRCPVETVLDTPARCPNGSEVGSGKAGGYARPMSAPAGVGTFVGLDLRMFVAGRNSLNLRAKTPLTTALIRGSLTKATGAQASAFGWRLRFTIPIELIQPAPGLVSQLTDFSATLPAQKYKGRPFAVVKSCPSPHRALLGFNGEFNSNLQRGNIGMGTSSPQNGEFTVNAVSPVVSASSSCR